LASSLPRSGFSRDLVLLLIVAYLLMLALQRPIKKISKWTRLPKGGAIFLTYLFFFLITVCLLSLILPSLINELINLSKQLDLSSLAPTFSEELANFNYSLKDWSEIFSRFSGSFSTIIKFIGSTFNSVFLAITLFVISVHLSFDHKEFYKKIYWFTDNENKVVKFQKFLWTLEQELGGWISGQIILMLIMGLLVFIGLSLIGVPYALPLGILAGLLEIVPNIGPIIAAIPAVILALAGGGLMPGIITTIFCVVIQQLENIFIVPTIMKNTAHVNPVISIVLILAGLEIFGVMGALLAVPIYIALRGCYGFWFKGRTSFPQNKV